MKTNLVIVLAFAFVTGLFVERCAARQAVREPAVLTPIDTPAPVQGSGHDTDSDAQSGTTQTTQAPAQLTMTYTDTSGGKHDIVTIQTGGETTAAFVKRHIEEIKLLQDAFPPQPPHQQGQ